MPLKSVLYSHLEGCASSDFIPWVLPSPLCSPQGCEPWDVPSYRDLVWGCCALGGQRSGLLQENPLWTVLTFLGSLRLAMCRV